MNLKYFNHLFDACRGDENLLSSHLCKVAWNRPDTSEPAHPETQTVVSWLLHVTRGQG